jgi:hypothetical protein
MNATAEAADCLGRSIVEVDRLPACQATSPVQQSQTSSLKDEVTESQRQLQSTALEIQ